MRMKCSWECDKEAVELKVKLLQGIYHTLQQESFVKGGQLRSSGLMNLMYLSTFKSVSCSSAFRVCQVYSGKPT